MRVRTTGVIPMEEVTIGIIGGDVALTNNVIAEIDFTYYFTNPIAAELILGTSKYEVVATNTTLSLQYHFLPKQNFNPYAGISGNYTIFYSQGKGRNYAVTDVNYEDAIGYGFQFRFDYKITDKMYWNVDVKKMYLNTDIDIATTLDLTVPAAVDLNPLLISTGIGFILF